MIDKYNRLISYLRISVTDRCNLRCAYCMPDEKVEWLPQKDILSFEEIAEVVRTGALLGIKKIRLTGGEPTVRKGIVNLVSILTAIKGIEEVSMTTNGMRLGQFAKPLKEAGLSRINISLDTLDPKKFKLLTRGGNINKVFEGIEAAQQAGFSPIKINIVRSKYTDNSDIEDVKNFCNATNLQYRIIRQMNLEAGEFSVVDGGDGGNCAICNRLRLTAVGELKPCLFSNEAFNVRQYGIEAAYHLALGTKPIKGESSYSHKFYQIGG